MRRLANPAFRLGRYYRQGKDLQVEIRPLTRDEATPFLSVARQHTPGEYPLFLCALRTGMRWANCSASSGATLTFTDAS